jgi:hypothetical protein
MPTPATEPRAGETELERVQRLNEGFVDPTDPAPADPKDPAEPEKKDPAIPTDPADDPAATDPTPAPAADPTPDPKKPDPAQDPADPEPEPQPQPRPARPERYIPVPKYKADKAAWEKREGELNAEIEQLRAASGQQPGTVTEDAEVTAFAKEHNLDEKAVRGLLALARKGIEIPKEQLQRIDAAAQAAKHQEEQTYFNSEIAKMLPSLKQQFPNATDEQLQAASTLFKKLGYTEKYLDKELDYILYREKTQFDEIFAVAPAPAPRKGGEQPRPGAGSPSTLTVADIKEDKDFERLETLADADQSRIVSQLPPLMYHKWVNWVRSREDQTLDVSRNGRSITLK